jgi:hypothetical protein
VTQYKNPSNFVIDGPDITEKLLFGIKQVLVNEFVEEEALVEIYNGQTSSPERLEELRAAVAKGNRVFVKHEEARHNSIDTRNAIIDEEVFIGIHCCYANYSDFHLTGTQISNIFQLVRRVIGRILSTKVSIQPEGKGQSVLRQFSPEGVLEEINIPGLVIQRPLFSIKYPADYSAFIL